MTGLARASALPFVGCDCAGHSAPLPGPKSMDSRLRLAGRREGERRERAGAQGTQSAEDGDRRADWLPRWPLAAGWGPPLVRAGREQDVHLSSLTPRGGRTGPAARAAPEEPLSGLVVACPPCMAVGTGGGVLGPGPRPRSLSGATRSSREGSVCEHVRPEAGHALRGLSPPWALVPAGDPAGTAVSKSQAPVTPREIPGSRLSTSDNSSWKPPGLHGPCPVLPVLRALVVALTVAGCLSMTSVRPLRAVRNQKSDDIGMRSSLMRPAAGPSPDCSRDKDRL